MERNLECISGEEVKKEVSSLQFLEIYFNQCLEYLRKTLLRTANSY